ncbi:MAG TPA: ankyrin repeat domain-containing protein [Terracidiphilus sp.]|nr:ankyrin repeat domain-containing protein [Terracidiphilus sp.]
MSDSELTLRKFVNAIADGEEAAAFDMLASSPQLAKASFNAGATRQAVNEYFLDRIKRYVVEGDTALHIAAAAYQTELVRSLIRAGADVQAGNRFGDQPLHAAAVGAPGSHLWNPQAQAETIICLIEAGADPNTADKRGVTPLHKAVRTRCASAVRALLEHGADPARKNKSGSTAMVLATHNTGRGGTGSPEAREQQREIVRLLEQGSS